jgi:hypothetical protein
LENLLKDKKKDFGILPKGSALEKDGLVAMLFIFLTNYFTSWNKSPIRS